VTVRVRDQELEDFETLAIHVVEANTAPVAGADVYDADEDTALNVSAAGLLANDTDADAGDVLTVSSVDTTGTLGHVTWNADGGFSYDPAGRFESLAAGDSAEDSFSYTVSDGRGGTDTAMVTITVAGVNDTPLAADDAYGTDEDTVLDVPAAGVLANDTDVDATDVLTVSSVDTTGTVGLVAWSADGGFSYDPAGRFEHLGAGESATEQFSYTVGDGQGGTRNATVRVAISGVNDAPAAADDSAATDEDAELAGLLQASDIEGDAPSFSLVDGAAHGTIEVQANGSYRYTPATDYYGADSFTFRANDGELDSNVATVSITVNPVNDAPVASDAAASMDEGTALVLVLEATDLDSTSLSFMVVDGPLHGALEDLGGGTLRYTPAADYSGADSFTFRASDGELDSNVATVSITVNPVDHAPQIISLSLDPASIDEDGTVTLSGLVTDPDASDGLTLTVDWGDLLAPDNLEVHALAAGTESFALTHRYLDDNPTATPADVHTIRAMVRDENGGEDADSTTVTVHNIAPVITELVTGVSGGCDSSDDHRGEYRDSRHHDYRKDDHRSHRNDHGEAGQYTISGLFTDPGTMDTHAATVDWGDGAVSEAVVTDSGGSGAFSASHTYASGGIYEVTISLTDDDGGVATRTTTIMAPGVWVEDGVLYVVGTDGDDHVSINRDRKGFKVHADFLESGEHGRWISAQGIERIEIHLGDGDDHAQIAGNIDLPALIVGGGGDDHLHAGRGPAVLLGEAGDDILIGGRSDDVLRGGPGDDILIGGPGTNVIDGGEGDDTVLRKCGGWLEAGHRGKLRDIHEDWTEHGFRLSGRSHGAPAFFPAADVARGGSEDGRVHGGRDSGLGHDWIWDRADERRDAEGVKIDWNDTHLGQLGLPLASGKHGRGYGERNFSDFARLSS
jgi:VCBS repeat-containing protein